MGGPHITAVERKRIIDARARGVMIHDIAEAFGRSETTIKRIIGRAGLCGYANRQISDEERAKMVGMYQAGATIAEVAKALQRTARRVSGVLHLAGVLRARKATPPRMTDARREFLEVTAGYMPGEGNPPRSYPRKLVAEWRRRGWLE